MTFDVTAIRTVTTPIAITNTLILIWFDIAKSSSYDQIILYKEYLNA